jgi:probable rRNA maturation factor
MDSSSIPASEDDGNAPRMAGAEDPHPEAPFLINRQRAARTNREELHAFLRQLSARVAGAPFSVCLLSDRGIRRYNKRYRRKDQATDVLAFPAGCNGKKEQSYLGDILISVETARQNAARYGLRLEEEIKILALHGLLHLMGYDHENDRGRMAREEKLWCARLGLSRGLTARSPKAARQPLRRRIALAGGQR